MPASGMPDLIALAYESACDLSRLQDMVVETARYFRADVATVAIWPRQNPANLMAASFGAANTDIENWLTSGEGPETLRARLHAAPPLQPFDGKTPSAASPGWPDGPVLAVVIDSGPSNVFALILVREGPAVFSQADHDSLTELARYMNRAVGMNQRFVRLFAEHRAARTLLDAAPRGILIIGQRGQATYVNNEARRIGDSNDGIALQDDQLQMSDSEAAAGYQDFLEAARANGIEDEDRPTLGLRICRPSDSPSYQLIAYALGCNPRQAALDEREGLAVVMLHDPSVAGSPDERLLHTYFELTPSEAQLTQALCSGHTLPVAAELASISVNTARTHLRSIFRKVGVHSQAALVQRISQSLNFTSVMD